MGIYVDYTLLAECTDESLRTRLETIRQRCLDLPLKWVGDVQRIEPVFNPLVTRMLHKAGYTLPAVIAQRLQQVEGDPHHADLCIAFAPMLGPQLPKRQLRRYFARALKLMAQTDLWSKDDLPEKVGDPTPWGFSTFTVYRAGIELEFASILLRYGYVLILHPGEGSETVNLALSTFAPPEGTGAQRRQRRSRKPPLWWGQGFTKTQYAKQFIQVHETVCRVLDIVQEEGLLLEGRDNCGYYANRSWKDASERVNEELLFARAVGGMMGVAVGDLREEGVPVDVLVDNASKTEPVDFSVALGARTGGGTRVVRDSPNAGTWIADRGRWARPRQGKGRGWMWRHDGQVPVGETSAGRTSASRVL